jgi:hypothetical protein
MTKTCVNIAHQLVSYSSHKSTYGRGAEVTPGESMRTIVQSQFSNCICKSSRRSRTLPFPATTPPNSIDDVDGLLGHLFNLISDRIFYFRCYTSSTAGLGRQTPWSEQ